MFREFQLKLFLQLQIYNEYVLPKTEPEYSKVNFWFKGVLKQNLHEDD